MGYTILSFLGFVVFAFYPLGFGEKPLWLMLLLMLAWGVAFFVSAVLQRAWPMAVLLVADLVARAFIADPNLIFYVPSYVVGLTCFAIVTHTLCPRCKTHLTITWSRWSVFDYRPYCLACGRSHEGVKPFQHVRQPEIWDGLYHDEGGGEQTDSAKTYTEYARGRWEKRQARQSNPRA